MTAFVVGIADDEESVHKSIKQYLHIYDPVIHIKEFYFTSEVEDYLYKNPEGLDILFLDQRFEGSTSGIESIPIVRKYAPKLPIVLLTSMDIEFAQLVVLGEKYDVAYIPKPIDTKQLAMKIENVKYQIRKYAELQKSIDLSLKLLAKGNIAGLKEYIQKDLNDNEKILLYDLEKLLESIKTCSKYDVIKQNLNSFVNSLKKYDSNIANNQTRKDVNVQKAISYIVDNMQNLIEYKSKTSCVCKIIKWCAINGYLQQAVTFYIEWLPKYLTEAYLIEVKDGDIITVCNANKHSWEVWERYFIREFRYKSFSQGTENSEIVFNKEVNRVIQQFKNFSGLNHGEREQRISVLASEDTLAGILAKAIIMFAEKAKKNFVYEVLNSSNCLICKILQNSCPSNTSFVNFLNQRLKNEKDIKNIMIKAIIGVKKQKLRELLLTANSTTKNELAKISNVTKYSCITLNTSAVAQNYLRMLNNNAVIINLPIENLIKFTEQYRKYNKQYRNQMNHANNSFDDESNADVISKSIIASVNLIDSEF